MLKYPDFCLSDVLREIFSKRGVFPPKVWWDFFPRKILHLETIFSGQIRG